jgi:HJR/Mrr/RecB family endonuclease
MKADKTFNSVKWFFGCFFIIISLQFLEDFSVSNFFSFVFFFFLGFSILPFIENVMSNKKYLDIYYHFKFWQKLFFWFLLLLFVILLDTGDIIVYSFFVIFLLLSILFVINKRIRQETRLKEEKFKRSKILREQKKLEKIRLEKEVFESKQRKKGLELFEGRWIKKEDLFRLKEIKLGLENNFANYSPYEFEKFIAKLFDVMGYQTKVTPKSGDYGIDVLAKKSGEVLAIQVKKYNIGNPVGNRDVQRLLGAMQYKNFKANHGLLITTSHFTVQAREQAKECPIELWDKHDLDKIIKKYILQLI